MANTKATTSKPEPVDQRPFPFVGLPVELQLEVFRHAMLVSYVDVISLDDNITDVSGVLVDANFLNVTLSCQLAAGVLKEIKRGRRHQGPPPTRPETTNSNDGPDSSLRRRHHNRLTLDARVERSMRRPDATTVIRIPVGGAAATHDDDDAAAAAAAATRFLAAPWARHVRHVAIEGYPIVTRLSGFPSEAEDLRDLVRGLARGCDSLATVVLAGGGDDGDDSAWDEKAAEAEAVRRTLPMGRGGGGSGQRAGAVRLLRGRGEGGLAVGVFTTLVRAERPEVEGCAVLL
ncbi:hypothetical protein GGTG_06949 [Gaeumannomyces tritici R3-111a-1]|uniref:Uncharacterized protein n=1 Tax=Gaeumannomyces tritici (strain R3-111a-1) TaxID=644352 RepID=J3P0A2_GAET3|nr:hypothetical protein GGTG_06949 [Gaeumannomyces tritici R3-111a-1]EJT77035.1 hypothetical protein GGTG_06949 [Gaeumannomyces tritici R3-111a-1]